MDRRNHLLREPGSLGGRPMHPLVAMEERIAAQHREIQALLFDNQRLAATHEALKHELSSSQKELRHISVAASNVKTDRDAQVRDVYERSLKMEAELRGVDMVDKELNQVREDTQKLNAVRVDLSSELRAITSDLAPLRAELRQATTMRAEIASLREEIQKGRVAIENEKKTRAENLEHEQAMETNMVAISRELEKLRAELANAEKRARAAAAAAAAANPGELEKLRAEHTDAEKRARAAAAAAAAANPGPGYAESYGNPDMGYNRGNSYAETYGMHQVQGVSGYAPPPAVYR